MNWGEEYKNRGGELVRRLVQVRSDGLDYSESRWPVEMERRKWIQNKFWNPDRMRDT